MNSKSKFTKLALLLFAGFATSPASRAYVVAIHSVTLGDSNELLTATVGGMAYAGGTVADAANSSSNVKGSMEGVAFDGAAPLTAGTAAPAGDTLATEDRVNVNIDGDVLTGSVGGYAEDNLAQSGGALNLQWGAGLTDNDADPDFFVFEDGGNDDVVVHAILADGTVGVGVSLPGWNVVDTGGTLYTQDVTSLTGRAVAGVSFAFTDLKDAAGANLTNGTMIKGIVIGDTQAADFYEVYANVEVVPVPSFSLVIAPNGDNAGNYDFTWNGQTGMVYDLVSALDLTAAPDTWAVWDDRAGLEATPPANTLTNIPGGGNDRRFFALVEKEAPPPPPLLSEDFEADDGGFLPVGTSNDWEWGTPNSDNDVGLALTSGNGGSANCWATVLGDGGAAPTGTIDPTADSILQSPAIDFTGVTGTELIFAAAVDAAAGDTIEVLVYEDGTDTLLDTLTPIAVPASSEGWAEFGPVDISAAAGSNAYLQFRYVGTDPIYIGLYLDDVIVRPTTP